MSLFDLNSIEAKMQNTLDNLSNSFKGIRTGRASTGLVDNITVEAYGQKMKLKDLATVSVPESRTIKINVWDNNMLVPLEKAILNSNLELNPMIEGQVIRINLPELTSERRAELAKSVKSLAEESKISLRNIRQEAMSNLKRSSKDENIPEDEVKEIQDKIQQLIDKFVMSINDLAKAKEEDILKI